MKLYFLLSIIFLCSFSLNAQTEVWECFHCKELIKGEYINVDTKFFHPHHFFCKHCDKIIKASFATDKNDYYHERCFKEISFKKCDVCKEPLIGEYLIDTHENYFHAYHEKEYERCDNCSRLITKTITKGGKTYSDGRKMCNICVKEAVKNPNLYENYFKNVIANLRNYGFKINSSRIRIKPVNRKELKKIAGPNYSNKLKGYCHSLITNSIIGNSESKEIKHIIYVLDAIPSEYIEAIIAHELMHAWIIDNTKNNHSSKLEEGSCNYLSYLVMKSKYSYNAKSIIKNMHNNPDPVYGEGYRKVYNKFKNGYLVELLNYLKKHTSI